MLKLLHNGGFFSCCSTRLHDIIHYYNTHHKLPTSLDSSSQFLFYKPADRLNDDIAYDYFDKNMENSYNINPYTALVNYHEKYQYSTYNDLHFSEICPFVTKYFYPSESISRLIMIMELKYIEDYDNTCVLFYRGNDKLTETQLCSYDDMITQAYIIKEHNPNIQFIIQSDETEFIERMLKEFPQAIYFKDEIRHIKKANTSVDIVFKDQNYKYSQYYLAITIMMSKCKYVICTSGNCSIWIALYRGNSHNIFQYLNGFWEYNYDFKDNSTVIYYNSDSTSASTARVFKGLVNLPKGSWSKSAQNYSIINNVLHAELLKCDGKYNSATIALTTDKIGYANNNGNFIIEELPKQPNKLSVNPLMLANRDIYNAYDIHNISIATTNNVGLVTTNNVMPTKNTPNSKRSTLLLHSVNTTHHVNNSLHLKNGDANADNITRLL